jgi:hypothetical protein
MPVESQSKLLACRPKQKFFGGPGGGFSKKPPGQGFRARHLELGIQGNYATAGCTSGHPFSQEFDTSWPGTVSPGPFHCPLFIQLSHIRTHRFLGRLDYLRENFFVFCSKSFLNTNLTPLAPPVTVTLLSGKNDANSKKTSWRVDEYGLM